MSGAICGSSRLTPDLTRSIQSELVVLTYKRVLIAAGTNSGATV